MYSFGTRYKRSAEHNTNPPLAPTTVTPQGYVAIPKSAKKDRIVANTQVFDFELTTEEIARLDALDECKFYTQL